MFLLLLYHGWIEKFRRSFFQKSSGQNMSSESMLTPVGESNLAFDFFFHAEGKLLSLKR